MDPISAGCLLAVKDEQAEPGLWFVIYADDEGAIAFDLTRAHETIAYAPLKAALKFEDATDDSEKIVLQGGPERPDDGLIILHETSAATEDSHRINDEFSFLSYNYVLIPGRPPAITTPDSKPSEIKLKKYARFLIAVGYRILDMPALKEEITAGNWICLPATPDIIFNTPRTNRRIKLLNQLN